MIKVGIVARFSNQWAAGKYYIENILCALQRNTSKLEITILTDFNEAINWSNKITSPESFKTRSLEPDYSKTQRISNKLSRIFTTRNLVEKRITDSDFDAVFPLGRHNEFPFQLLNKRAYWIPDFQEIHYPENFDKQQLELRKSERREIAQQDKILVLSSHSAKDDFHAAFPDAKCPIYVLPFSVYNNIPQNIDEESILKKYRVEKHKFFICPNQFWKHKNQKVLIKAAKLVKVLDDSLEFSLLFTGKESGFLGEGSFLECKKEVETNQLTKTVSFLGFIDRIDLLVLIKNSAALLQSSQFEGWNTSIEDAKSLNTRILASNLDVHKEQLPNQKLINCNDEKAWAEEMISTLRNPGCSSLDYRKEQIRFENSLLDLIKLISNQ